MQVVEYFYSERSKERKFWQETYAYLEARDIPIHTAPVECDISVVLSGCFVNPLPLKGRKVLALKIEDWVGHKWRIFFEPIMGEYYDQIVDVTGMKAARTIEAINAAIH